MTFFFFLPAVKFSHLELQDKIENQVPSKQRSSWPFSIDPVKQTRTYPFRVENDQHFVVIIVTI